MTFVKGPNYDPSMERLKRKLALNKREVIHVDFRTKRIIKNSERKVNYER